MNDPELLDALKRSMLALKQVKQRARELEEAAREPIAIVGLGCRFAGGAEDPAAFWDMLDRGVDAVREVPRDRWNVDELYDPSHDALGKMVTREAAFLASDPLKFDAAFFGITPREARGMDPQQRLLLEVAWETLENAAIVPETLMGSSTGVFVGTNVQEYASPSLEELPELDGYVLTGTHPSVAAGRISYVLGCHGPSITVDTACSSSLVAVHLACQSLRAGECNVAIAGGTGLLLAPTLHVEFSRLRGLAMNGRCKAFDAAADGMGWGEGCGLVLLKRLSDAERDGNRVLAIVRGSAVNQDGRSNGLTAPNGPAQQQVITRALERAGVAPADVVFVETHGAGTPLGDPIEVQALGAALAPGRSPSSPVLLGSVKTNIGHTMAAAGVAGLIKTVLALHHGRIPQNLHFGVPSPHIPWKELPVKVATAATPWPSERRRIAGVSSFGVSGTNAHVILENAPASKPPPSREASVERSAHLLVLSAKTEQALLLQATRYAEHLREHPELPLADVCYTAANARSHFEERLAVVASSPAEARDRLLLSAKEETATGCVWGHPTPGQPPRVAFLFTGQGSQYAGMARDLFETEPTFRASLERCAAILEPLLERPLLSVIYPSPGEETPLDETNYTQPALFAIEYALAELWRSWGVEPFAVMGHSVGEYTAACVAGVLRLEDALTLIAARGRLMHALPRDGEMASVKADARTVEKILARHAGDVEFGAFNGPESVVISGRRAKVREVCQELEQRGIKTKTLNVSIASHSPLMDPMLGEFERIASERKLEPPRARLISNLTGTLAGPEVATSDYWRRHVREAVRFEQGMKALRALGVDTFLEIGPQATLLGMGALCVTDEGCSFLPSLKKNESAWPVLLESLGHLHVRGAPIDFRAFDAAHPRQSVNVPTYAFHRQKYALDWVRSTEVVAGAAAKSGSYALSGLELSIPGDAVHRIVRIGPNQRKYLFDHRVHGQIAVSGAFHIAALLAAAVDSFGAREITLQSVRILRPLVVTKDTTLHVLLTPTSETEFAVRLCTSADDAESGSTTWRDHVEGTLTLHVDPLRNTASLGELREVASTPVEVDAVFERLRAAKIAMGPEWRCLKQASRTTDGTALVHAEYGAGIGAGEAPLHPVLLDNAFVAALLAHQETERDETPYLFAGFERLRWYGDGTEGATEALWCHGRERTASLEARTADLVFFNEGGSALLEIEGMTFRRAEPTAFSSLARTDARGSTFEVAWRRMDAPASPSQPTRPSRWIVASANPSRAAALTRALDAAGATSVVCDFATVADRFREEEARGAVDGVLCWWSPSTSLSDDPAHRAEAQALTAATVIQALSRGARLKLAWVTEGAQAVVPTDSVSCDMAALWGLGRIVAQEHPALGCSLIDVDHATDDAATAVAGILLRPNAESQIALRGSQFYVPRLVPSKAPALEAAPAIHDGTVLVTGGLGGLGLRVAEWLVEHRGARHLLLVGRTSPNEEKRARLDRLRAKGAEITVVRADVAIPSDVARMLSSVPKAHPLRGIVHAAGVAHGELVANLDAARLSEVFHPKARGAWNLHEQTKGYALDFFVLFSSLQSLVGSPTQGAYATANAFLDGLSHYRRSLGLPAQSLNWGAWGSGDGMAAQLSETERVRLARAGFGMLAPEEALSLLEQAMNLPQPQVMLAPIDLGSVRRSLNGDEADPLLRELVQPAANANSALHTAAVRLRQKLQNANILERERIITELVRTEAAAAMRLFGPSAVPVNQPLKKLGLDSLMALEIPNRLKARTGCALPSTLLYEHPTIRELAAFLLSKLDVSAKSAPNASDVLAALKEATLEDIRALNLLEPLAALTHRIRSRAEHRAQDITALDAASGSALGAASDEHLFSLIDGSSPEAG